MNRTEINNLLVKCYIVKIYNKASISDEFKHLYNKPKWCFPEHLTKGSNKKVIVCCPLCGKHRKVSYYNLYRPNTLGICDKCNKERIEDLTINNPYNYFTALRISHRKNNKTFWLCECVCGKLHIVRSDALKNGSVTNCGCISRNKAKIRITEYNRIQGNFIKEDHTKEEILKHLEMQSKRRENIANFTAQVAKDRNYLCYFTCKNEYSNIEVHHIQSKSKYPKLTYELNNVVCLRKDIHKEFHKMYGYGGNDVSQFYEFLTLYARR